MFYLRYKLKNFKKVFFYYEQATFTNLFFDITLTYPAVLHKILKKKIARPAHFKL